MECNAVAWEQNLSEIFTGKQWQLTARFDSSTETANSTVLWFNHLFSNLFIIGGTSGSWRSIERGWDISSPSPDCEFCASPNFLGEITRKLLVQSATRACIPSQQNHPQSFSWSLLPIAAAYSGSCETWHWCMSHWPSDQLSLRVFGICPTCIDMWGATTWHGGMDPVHLHRLAIPEVSKPSRFKLQTGGVERASCWGDVYLFLSINRDSRHSWWSSSQQFFNQKSGRHLHDFAKFGMPSSLHFSSWAGWVLRIPTSSSPRRKVCWIVPSDGQSWLNRHLDLHVVPRPLTQEEKICSLVA